MWRTSSLALLLLAGCQQKSANPDVNAMLYEGGQDDRLNSLEESVNTLQARQEQEATRATLAERELKNYTDAVSNEAGANGRRIDADENLLASRGR